MYFHLGVRSSVRDGHLLVCSSLRLLRMLHLNFHLRAPAWRRGRQVGVMLGAFHDLTRPDREAVWAVYHPRRSRGKDSV